MRARSRGGARVRFASLLGSLVALSSTAVVRADSSPAAAVVDRVVLRFYAPETGSSSRPRFITERMLAFETRLEAAMDGASLVGGPPSGPGPETTSGTDPPASPGIYQDRYVRAAMEHHIAEEMLASLEVQSDGAAEAAKPRDPRGPGNPGEAAKPATDQAELAPLAAAARAALIERVGGADALREAAEAEGILGSEVDAILRRQARAAYYIDREIAPILHPSEEQLREVYRTSAHPYKGKKFETIHEDLERWFVAERLRVAELAFLQSARSRVKIIIVAH